MRIFLMCEGTNEETLLNILLDANMLSFTRDDLIGRRPYFVRQLDSPVIRSELKHYGLPVKIYRIGDKQTDPIVIPNELKFMISKKEIYKYCTKPEMEMLLILTEGLEKEYEKVKSTISPKEFTKKYIKYQGRKYDQSNAFLEAYYGGKNINKLVDSLKKYKAYKRKHRKDEFYLADLLKSKKKEEL